MRQGLRRVGTRIWNPPLTRDRNTDLGERFHEDCCPDAGASAWCLLRRLAARPRIRDGAMAWIFPGRFPNRLPIFRPRTTATSNTSPAARDPTRRGRSTIFSILRTGIPRSTRRTRRSWPAGEGKATPGCASCHLASGSGHPESANLTGLTDDYIMTQLHDFQQGTAHRSAPPHERNRQGHDGRGREGRGGLFSRLRSRANGSAWWRPTPFRKPT